MRQRTTVTGLGERFQLLNEIIADVVKRHRRDAHNVKLLAVSKRRTSAEIRQCALLGQVAFGENYLQEALPKINDCQDLRLEWHFIGRIQRNKTTDVAKNFDWVHTVDRISVAKRLNDQRPEELAPLEVCVQVNLDGALNKAGVPPGQLTQLLAEVSGLKRLRLRGLMTMPEPSEGVELQRLPFQQLATLLAAAAVDYPAMDVLSMGMSGDMDAAVAEGSTLLRIGTALFGPRP
ncbi:MAG: YggS family pyridoxal phosphate-dependent enzyme [Immundisolibacteraceae bacterium]|nr:YggS family pyridoxal phosphate-dependent enzyme [Immundisolibacteraceae bacterium]